MVMYTRLNGFGRRLLLKMLFPLYLTLFITENTHVILIATIVT